MKSTDERRTIVLVCAMRNEGPYVLEWLAYHLAIGFTDVVICTNDCLDETPRLLDLLQDRCPLVHLRSEVAEDQKPQLLAYQMAEALPVVRRADWAMVLDADEFLNIHVGRGTVPDLIDAVPDSTAFLVNWRVFGSGGHVTWEPACVDRFTMAAARSDASNSCFKSLFSKLDVYGCKLLPHGPLYADENRLHELNYVDGGGRKLPARFAAAKGFLQTDPDAVSWALAQINHYNTRAWEDYLVKHHRGGGITREWDRDWNWKAFNKNDEEDTTILGRMGPARALMRSFLADREVREQYARCCELYGRHVRDLKGSVRSTAATSSG